MSKLYYDHLIILEDVEAELDQMSLSSEDKSEFENMIEELIHHRVMDCVLTHLPKPHHAEFLEKFSKAPFDPSLIRYIDQRIESSIEMHIKDEMETIKKELLRDLKSAQKK